MTKKPQAFQKVKVSVQPATGESLEQSAVEPYDPKMKTQQFNLLFSKLEQQAKTSEPRKPQPKGVTSPNADQLNQYHAVMAQYSAGPLSIVQSPTTGDFLKQQQKKALTSFGLT